MSIPSLSLKNKVALITGGKQGIGRAIALGFAEAGADVAICDQSLEDGELEKLAKEIQKLGRCSLTIMANISLKTDVDNMFQKVISEFKAIDILVNNAGIVIAEPVIETQENNWDTAIDTNLKGCFLCSQAAARQMISQKKGCIINIASIGGLQGSKTGIGAYNISKAGVIMLTRQFAWDLGKYNIRVNGIAPGLVRAETAKAILDDPEALKQREAIIPLRKIGEPSDIVGPALFLASEAASHISGHTIVVDGGETV